jgi:hypothetical protein
MGFVVSAHSTHQMVKQLTPMYTQIHFADIVNALFTNSAIHVQFQMKRQSSGRKRNAHDEQLTATADI